MKVFAVIPARFNAMRLPGKPLALIGAKPMIQWVYEGTKRARGIDEVLIATDDERITNVANSFDAPVIQTSKECASGTDRIAEVARRTEGDIYINVQGDEPFIEPEVIEAALDLVKSGKFEMASAMTPIISDEEFQNPSVVKTLVDRSGRALYFSRLPIPFTRDSEPSAPRWRHLGIYVYTRDALLTLSSLPPSPIEKDEKLEQLRALEFGMPIGLAQVHSISRGIDTPEDLTRANHYLKEHPELEAIR